MSLIRYPPHRHRVHYVPSFVVNFLDIVRYVVGVDYYVGIGFEDGCQVIVGAVSRRKDVRSGVIDYVMTCGIYVS